MVNLQDESGRWIARPIVRMSNFCPLPSPVFAPQLPRHRVLKMAEALGS